MTIEVRQIVIKTTVVEQDRHQNQTPELSFKLPVREREKLLKEVRQYVRKILRTRDQR